MKTKTKTKTSVTQRAPQTAFAPMQTQAAGNQAALAKLRPYMPGDDPFDTPNLAKVTKEMRLESLARVLGELAGRQAALTKQADDLKKWLASNQPSKAMLKKIKADRRYQIMKSTLKLQALSLRSTAVKADLERLKLRDAAAAKRIEQLDIKITASDDEMYKIDQRMDLILGNLEVLKEQEEYRRVEALAARLGLLAGKQAALSHIARVERGKLWDAEMKAGAPPKPNLGQKPQERSNQPPPSAKTIMSVQ